MAQIAIQMKNMQLPNMMGTQQNDKAGSDSGNKTEQEGAVTMEDTAVLSSFDKYTTFSFGGKTLTFRTCDGLEKYTRIILWHDGYIEVMAKYRQEDKEVEEYIDLTPVLEGLYMGKASFLAPIKEVRIEYA